MSWINGILRGLAFILFVLAFGGWIAGRLSFQQAGINLFFAILCGILSVDSFKRLKVGDEENVDPDQVKDDSAPVKD